MASTIKIKRSGTSASPLALYSGELAYSWVSNKLYIGIGNTNSDDASIVAIGGEAFTQYLNVTPGTLSPSSAIVVDANSKIDNLLVDRLQLNGQTLSTTTTNADLYITPDGTGKTVITNLYIGDTATSLQEYIQDVSGGAIADSSEIAATYDDNTGSTSLALKTTGVSAGSYGSATEIPTFTVDSKGRLSAAGTVNVATSLSISGDSGSDTVSLLTDTLSVQGGEGIDVVVTDNTITISGENASTTNKGVASFNSTHFSVTNGAVSANDLTFNSDSGSAASTIGESFSIVGGEGIDTSAVGTTITITAELATTTNAGVASFSSNSFNVDTAGEVTIASGGVSNTQLANSSITIGSTTIGLGHTSTTLDGLTELTVDNLNINGNEIQSTNANGDIVFNPNGTGNIDVSGAKITNVAEPQNPSDAATKNYVDNAVTGLTWKQSVNLLAVSNIPLTGSTNTVSIDGHVTLTSSHNGYRLLLTGQTSQAQNGIYVYTDAGAGYTLTRPTDADTYEELIGVSVFVMEGTTYGNSGWTQANHYLNNFGEAGNFQNWVQFSGAGAYSAGAGLGQTGTEFFVNVATNGGIEIVSDELRLKSTLAGDGLTYTDGVLDIGGTADRITVNAGSIDIASTYDGQTSITTLGTVTTGTWSANTIAVNKGGTGLTSYSAGDLLYATGSTTLTKLAIGNPGEVLQVNSSGLPTWGAIDGGMY